MGISSFRGMRIYFTCVALVKMALPSKPRCRVRSPALLPLLPAQGSSAGKSTPHWIRPEREDAPRNFQAQSWGRRGFTWKWDPGERTATPGSECSPPRATALPQIRSASDFSSIATWVWESSSRSGSDNLWEKFPREFPDRRRFPMRLCKQHFGPAWGAAGRKERALARGRGPKLCPMSRFLR